MDLAPTLLWQGRGNEPTPAPLPLIGEGAMDLAPLLPLAGRKQREPCPMPLWQEGQRIPPHASPWQRREQRTPPQPSLCRGEQG